MADNEFSTADDTFTDADIERLLNTPAYISKEQMFDLEATASCGEVGQKRRCMLGVLTRSVPELMKASTDSPEIYAEIVDAIASFKSHAEALLTFARAAEARLMIADERDLEEKAAV